MYYAHLYEGTVYAATWPERGTVRLGNGVETFETLDAVRARWPGAPVVLDGEDQAAPHPSRPA